MTTLLDDLQALAMKHGAANVLELLVQEMETRSCLKGLPDSHFNVIRALLQTAPPSDPSTTALITVFSMGVAYGRQVPAKE